MHHIIYMSQAQAGLTPTDLVALLMQARRANEQQGITGVLVYGDGQFMQVMEGERAKVEALYERVKQDARHHNVFKMADKDIAERVFVNWMMGFGELPAEQFTDLTGYMSPEQWEQLDFSTTSVDQLFYRRLRELVTTSSISS